MSYISDDAWKEVNNALINTGAAGVRQIIDTGNSSIKRRR
jgi:hypothetical protein